MLKKVTIILTLSIIFFIAFIGLRQYGFPGHRMPEIIQSKESIQIELWLDFVPGNPEKLFRTEENAYLIVRNRPHGKLPIINAQCSKILLNDYYLRHHGLSPTNNAKQPTISQCNLVLQANNAIKTENGYLSNGNPLKIGSKIHIEGPLYSLKGYLININSI